MDYPIVGVVIFVFYSLSLIMTFLMSVSSHWASSDHMGCTRSSFVMSQKMGMQHDHVQPICHNMCVFYVYDHSL